MTKKHSITLNAWYKYNHKKALCEALKITVDILTSIKLTGYKCGILCVKEKIDISPIYRQWTPTVKQLLEGFNSILFIRAFLCIKFAG